MKKILLLLLLFPSVLFAQKAKTVVLTFDDAPQSHYSFVAPLLKQLGFKATFYVCEFPGVYPDSTISMNWRQIGWLAKMGFEIGNHTKDHVPLKASNEQELTYIEHKCDSLGIARPVSFAYPAYIVDTTSFPLLKKHGYINARIGGNRVYSPKNDDPYYVPSYTITNDSAKLFYTALKQAVKGKVVVFTFHGIPDKPHPWVTTDQQLFMSFMKYLKDNHYHTLAMRDLKRYQRNR
jgi:hypothetical protein